MIRVGLQCLSVAQSLIKATRELNLFRRPHSFRPVQVFSFFLTSFAVQRKG